jgi:hypothetical protein
VGPLLVIALMSSMPDSFTDNTLATYATHYFQSAREQAPMGETVIGMMNETKIVADVRCGDVCPAYTVRILHYAVDPGPACKRAGGEVATLAVPISIAVMKKDFCVPGVLYRERLYTDPH